MVAIYAISDLHLCLSVDKPMDVFGAIWENYVQRLHENWRRIVAPQDIVLLPGDISWSTYIRNAYEDFQFINDLPGTKIITKGNHDYWWETLSKLNGYLDENGFDTIRFLHNSTYCYEDTVICGTKGYPDPTDLAAPTAEDDKLFLRELSRLELSLKKAQESGQERIIVLLHYPPRFNGAYTELMERYGVAACVYGHLHAQSQRFAQQGEHNGVIYRLVSCDYLKFTPVKIF